MMGFIDRLKARTTNREKRLGRGFATGAGYVAHAICETYCTDRQK